MSATLARTCDGSGTCRPAATLSCGSYACNGTTCQCPGATCGNGIIEAGESCELPAIGCGPLQQCTACTACAP